MKITEGMLEKIQERRYSIVLYTPDDYFKNTSGEIIVTDLRRNNIEIKSNDIDTLIEAMKLLNYQWWEIGDSELSKWNPTIIKISPLLQQYRDAKKTAEDELNDKLIKHKELINNLVPMELPVKMDDGFIIAYVKRNIATYDPHRRKEVMCAVTIETIKQVQTKKNGGYADSFSIGSYIGRNGAYMQNQFRQDMVRQFGKGIMNDSPLKILKGIKEQKEQMESWVNNPEQLVPGYTKPKIKKKYRRKEKCLDSE